MDFRFTQDQLLFRDTVRDFLAKECAPEHLRALQDTASARSEERWQKCAEMGLTGLLVPEGQGGLGFADTDFVLIAEECGRAALPEPLIDTAAIAAPLLSGLADQTLAQDWLPKLAEGQAKIAIDHPVNLYVCDAKEADLLLILGDGKIFAAKPGDFICEACSSVDPLRKIYTVNYGSDEFQVIARGEEAERLSADALNRGALYAAAQSLGLAQAMVDMSVAYACERQQFGKAIGTYQAIKHQLANVQVKIEFARPVVYRAAHSMAQGSAETSLHVSHAKLAAGAAAEQAAKTAIQVHGAMGYTWEVDLHFWMKRSLALQGAWGDKSFHLQRVQNHVLESDHAIGPGETFVA